MHNFILDMDLIDSGADMDTVRVKVAHIPGQYFQYQVRAAKGLAAAVSFHYAAPISSGRWTGTFSYDVNGSSNQ